MYHICYKHTYYIDWFSRFHTQSEYNNNTLIFLNCIPSQYLCIYFDATFIILH